MTTALLSPLLQDSEMFECCKAGNNMIVFLHFVYLQLYELTVSATKKFPKNFPGGFEHFYLSFVELENC